MNLFIIDQLKISSFLVILNKKFLNKIVLLPHLASNANKGLTTV